MATTSEKIVFALVGLPARGKSFLSAKIVTFFSWSGIPSRIFNAGSKRRAAEGAAQSGRSSFFDSSNDSAVSRRDEIALSTLSDALQWLLTEGGSIAIFDATNTTRARRQLIQRFINSTAISVKLVFIESICNNEQVLRENFLQKVRNSPDFSGLSEEAALEDLRLRVKAYESVYETIDDEEHVPYIKIIDLANKVVTYKIWGTIQLRCVQLLLSCHVGQRPVYLVRAGHCEGVDNLSDGKWFQDTGVSLGRIEGACGPYAAPTRIVTNACHDGHVIDPNFKMPSSRTSNAHLSASGLEFAERLAKFIRSRGHGDGIVSFSSTMPRALETLSALQPAGSIQQWSSLGMLDTGILHGLSVRFIRENMPEEYVKWESDPIHYRFPGGESIIDMNKRLAEVVLEIEHQNSPVVVVSHLSTIQSIVAYFTGKSPCVIPHILIPRHAVVVLQPAIYGWTMSVVPEEELPPAA